MKNSNHIIEKVLLEVNTSKLETAHSIRNNIDTFLKDELFPSLELLFDEYDFEDEIIRLDELTLDLSIEKGHDFSNLPTEVYKQLKEKIDRQMSFQKELKSDSVESSEAKKQNVMRISAAQNSGNVFLFFLENGHMPWFGKEEQISSFTLPEVWEKNLDDGEFFRKFDQILGMSETAADRFVMQFPGETITAYLRRKNLRIHAETSAILKISQNLDKDGRRIFLKLLIRLAHDDFPRVSEIFDRLIFGVMMEEKRVSKKIVIPEIEQFKKLFQRLLPETSVQDSVLEKIDLLIEGQSLESNQSKKSEEQLIGKISETEQFNKLSQRHISETSGQDSVSVKNDVFIEGHSSISNPPRKSEKQSPDKKIKTEEEKLEDKPISVNLETKHSSRLLAHKFLDKNEGQIWIQNAGLILLHPFLKQFFTSTGIIGKPGNLAHESFDLAVQSLHYLATGNENTFEGNLIFEKFLCGVPLKMPIQRQTQLNEQIKNEANELLNAVVKNWPALKNTSADGLRQMFIQRDGKLFQEEAKYKLIVERKAQDVLLESLSWNIAVIKLPWISNILFTEW